MNAIRLAQKILILAFAMLTAGISSTSAQLIPTPFELAGTSWQLVKIHGRDDSTRTPDDPAKYTIAIASDNRVTVRIDCNRGSGDWKSTGPGYIQFGPLALTKVMCPPGSLHNQFVRDWSRVRRYVIQNGNLFLTIIPGGSTYEFEPLGGTQASLYGKKWKLTEVNDAGVNSSHAYIQFDDATKRISGDGGCNRFAGNFEINGASLKFSHTLSTKRACVDQNIQQVENSFIGNLERVTAYEIRGDELRLNGNGRSLLTFQSESAATGEVPAQGHVTGTVTYLQRIALPRTAVIRIYLRDVTRSTRTIAEQTINAQGRQVPFAFELRYEAARIEPSHHYVVEAQIEHRGRLLFRNTQSYPVITQGSPNTVNVLVRRVR